MQKRVIVICCLLLLAACQQVFTSQKKETAGTGEFRVGTEGLRMSFLRNLPPDRIFDTEGIIPMTLQVENRGTALVGGPNDLVFLSGFDPSIITNIPTTGQKIPRIHPRDQFTPQGGIDHVSFEGKITSLQGKGIDRYPARIQATLCYQYQTIASTNVCIDPNPFLPTIQPKVCVPTSVSLGSQGAPVAVTLVELDPALGKTRFRINIQNIGGGEVFRPSALAKCSPFSTGLNFNEIDYVKINKVKVQDKDLIAACSPLNDKHLRLTNNAGTLFCELTGLTGTAVFASPLVVQLEYGYRSTILKNTEINIILKL